jgi:GxxExxY protein
MMMKYEDLTKKVIGCAMEVHNTLGIGFPEVIYQRALAYELKMEGINFVREYEVDVFYKDICIGKRRVDFIIERTIFIELKAVSEIMDVHLNQGLNYLVAFNMEVGLLINFGADSLQFRRLHNNKLLTSQTN